MENKAIKFWIFYLVFTFFFFLDSDDNSQDFYVGPCYFLNADGQVLPGSCCLDTTVRDCESDYLPEGTLCGSPEYYNLCSATGKCQGPKGDKGITFFKNKSLPKQWLKKLRVIWKNFNTNFDENTSIKIKKI